MLKDDLNRYIDIKAEGLRKKLIPLSYKTDPSSLLEAARINGYAVCLKDIMEFIQAYGGDK